MAENYLINNHKDDLLSIMRQSNTNNNYSINLNFLELFEDSPSLGNAILKDPDKSLKAWNQAACQVQVKLLEERLSIKPLVNCRIYSLPVCPELHRTRFPDNYDCGKFLQVTGTVVRMTETKLLEQQRTFVCSKCKFPLVVEADFERRNLVVAPKRCGNPEGCSGTNLVAFGDLSDHCLDYQEIKIQEQVSKLGIGAIPSTMWVCLDADLVDICKPGDSLIICGVVKRRWNSLLLGKKLDIELVLKANHVQVNNSNSFVASVTRDTKEFFQEFWAQNQEFPLCGRDAILKAFCSQIFGLYVVKLAICMVLAGGSPVEDKTSTGVNVRSESHLLLVGDPGTGKSQLLRFASKVIPRAVLTTGIGSTAAGLTVTALMENGEWQLEGGALVMADGGICCIDEFNSMRDHDRTSIHEAMEQQTISVAKASIVCKLSTKCSILAACNPKGNLDPTQPLCMNLALASPLLSRFDLILSLRDSVSKTWDNQIADYVLNSQKISSKFTDTMKFPWNLEQLQAYFATIKKITPYLTEQSRIVLSNYYQFQRQITNRNKARTTVRFLDSLVRLSQGHARLMFHDKVELIDAIFAVVLVDASMDLEASLLNLDLSEINKFPENPTQFYKNIAEKLLEKMNLNELLQEITLVNCNQSESILQSHYFVGDNAKKDLDLLKLIPSENDDLPAVNFDEASVITSTQTTELGEGSKKLILASPSPIKRVKLDGVVQTESTKKASLKDLFGFKYKPKKDVEKSQKSIFDEKVDFDDIEL